MARAAKPRVTNQRAGEGSGTRNERLSFLVPDPSAARCAGRLVSRGFAARATSIITTKLRACSQASTSYKIYIYNTFICNTLKRYNTLKQYGLLKYKWYLLFFVHRSVIIVLSSQ